MHTSRIRLRHVLRQLKDDFIGKDSYRGVTFTYSWMANQFGHFGLGYIPTIIACHCITRCFPHRDIPPFRVALFVSAGWLLFELYNFLGPLLLHRPSKANGLYLPAKDKYVFQPAWGNIAFDTSTDLLFFWLGAYTAALLLDPSAAVKWVLLGLGLALLYPAHYWFLTKMYLQYARFPTQFRLSQWERQADDGRRMKTDVIRQYIQNAAKGGGHHLLMFGGRRSGKSLLAIGMGTELSIKRCTGSYYTAIKLFSLFSLNDEEIVQSEKCEVWSWRSASLLIIDDINPGWPVNSTFLSPEEVLRMICTTVHGDPNVNKDCLRDKNVIWVLGDEAVHKRRQWRSLLEDLNVSSDKVSEIQLSDAK